MLERAVKVLLAVPSGVANNARLVSGKRIQIRNALRHGATQEVIMEVLALVSVCGMHSATEGVPILVEELDRFAKAAE